MREHQQDNKSAKLGCQTLEGCQTQECCQTQEGCQTHEGCQTQEGCQALRHDVKEPQEEQEIRSLIVQLSNEFYRYTVLALFVEWIGMVARWHIYTLDEK